MSSAHTIIKEQEESIAILLAEKEQLRAKNEHLRARLLEHRVAYWDRDKANGLLSEAAAAIERLDAENQRLRANLRAALQRALEGEKK